MTDTTYISIDISNALDVAPAGPIVSSSWTAARSLRNACVALLAGCLLAWQASAFAETITIAAEDDWAPYSFVRPDGSGIAGLSPELVRAAFKTQGVDVSFTVEPFARCMHSAETGAVVACFDASITETNRDQFHWHATPLLHEELAIFARSESSQKGLTTKDLEGHLVGITIGYTYPTSLLENPRIRTVDVASDENLISMLLAGRVDYVLLNTMPAFYRASREPRFSGRIRRVGRVQLDGFWLAFSRKRPDGKRLCDMFERGLLEIRRNGVYDGIVTRYLASLGMPAQ